MDWVVRPGQFLRNIPTPTPSSNAQRGAKAESGGPAGQSRFIFPSQADVRRAGEVGQPGHRSQGAAGVREGRGGSQRGGRRSDNQRRCEQSEENQERQIAGYLDR